MFTHSDIWSAIDKIAERNGLSASGLSRRAGLDATSFNKSKRITGGGRPRWPSTESLAKVLNCTNTSLGEFVSLMQGEEADSAATSGIPVLSLADAGRPGAFDDAGFPSGHDWRTLKRPRLEGRYAYAIELTTSEYAPVFRQGDVIIAAPDDRISRGDRLIVRSHDGSLKLAVMYAQDAATVELGSLVQQNEVRVHDTHDIDWMARINWVRL